MFGGGDLDENLERSRRLERDAMWEESVHLKYLAKAIDIANNCRDIEWYAVGCVIVGPDQKVLSTGYTGELKEPDGKFRHAEDVAIAKARHLNIDLSNSVLYSTLEPCSIRASGKTPCVARIIDAKIPTVVFGAREPYDPDLDIVCEGRTILAHKGVNVVHIKEMESQCLKSAISRGIQR